MYVKASTYCKMPSFCFYARKMAHISLEYLGASASILFGK